MSAVGERGPRIAIVGATGTVGSQLLELIELRGFSYAELQLFAGSAGKSVEHAGRSLPVYELTRPGDLSAFDIAFLAVPASVAREIASSRPGPLLIDLSAAGRPPSKLPLTAPGLVAREELGAPARGGLLETPHPAAHALAVVIGTLNVEEAALAVTILESASANGINEVERLVRQTTDALSGRLGLEEDEEQLAFNVLSTDAATRAAAIRAQVVRLLPKTPAPSLRVVRVPALHGTAIVVHLSAGEASSQWPARLRSGPGLLFVEPEEKPPTLADALGQEAILVSLDCAEQGATLWCLLDAPRLAAMFALWAAEAAGFAPTSQGS